MLRANDETVRDSVGGALQLEISIDGDSAGDAITPINDWAG